MTSSSRRRRRWFALATAGVAAAALVAGGVWWIGNARPDPEPRFPAGSDVYIATGSPLPPGSAGDTLVSLELGRRAGDEIELTLFDSKTNDQIGLMRGVGETLALGRVTIRVCAIWAKDHPLFEWGNDETGSTEYSTRLYYVVGTNGTAPECPERVD